MNTKQNLEKTEMRTKPLSKVDYLLPRRTIKSLAKNKRGSNLIVSVLIGFVYVAFIALVAFTAYYLLVYILGAMGAGFLAIFGIDFSWDFGDTTDLIRNQIIPIFGDMLWYVLYLFETLMYWLMHLMGANPTNIPSVRALRPPV